ncbi:MAG TPA: hypothetical protein ENN99_06250 [Chloroflexi bacterium]|nr:hypothetical protein [Chloroflexota bacterium]
MANKIIKETIVDLEIFPLPIVESALYVLSERIDGCIGEEADGKITLTLVSLEEGLDSAGMERLLNQALIAASVNERAFQIAAPIRNYLAQTALSITTESQQTIEEFAASVGSERADEHAGAPTDHVDISLPEGEDGSTATGVQLTVDEESSRVLLQLNGRKYLLPDALWAAHEMRDTCTCSISNMPHGQLFVTLEPKGEEANLNTLGERFEHWLDVALERSQ